MAYRNKPLDSFSGVAKNSTATVTLPGGVVYDALHFEFNEDANFTIAQIQAVRLNLNGEDIIDVSGTVLQMIEAYKGNAAQTGYFTLQLAEILAKTFDGSLAYGLITTGKDAVSVEVAIGDTGTTVPTLEAFAETRAIPLNKDKQPMRRRFVPKLRRFTNNASAGGPFEISTLPRRPDVRYKRIYFEGANINGLEIERDGYKPFKLTKARNEYFQKRWGATPQADHVVFDPIVRGWAMADTFATASASLVFRLEMAAAGQADAIVESVWIER